MILKTNYRVCWLIGVLLIISLVTFTKGCHLFRRNDSPTGPVRGNRHGLSLRFAENAELAKATGITIEGVASRIKLS